MSKIASEHLERSAYIYIRQSTPDQVRRNPESRRRQYSLETRARQLGWQEVVVVDEDLGRSGAGTERPGFDRLIAAICKGDVGAVLSTEASRLARNGRDWHTLLEFCGLVNTLLIDEDGVYDPRHPNDRLLLGMKGTISEMELATFRRRSQEALKLMSQRGELYTTVAVGYRRVDEQLEKEPSRRVQESIELVFAKFRELGSIRQVLLWLREERIELPAVHYGPEGRDIVWKLPVYSTVHKFLTNPVYAGTYAWGRTGSQVRIEDGRKHVTRGTSKPLEEWNVLLTEHHEGYITWDQYQVNQAIIAQNANCKGAMVRGAVRRGEALLPGLLRCGHCGRKLSVQYGGKQRTPRYACVGANVNHGTGEWSCISFGALMVDRAVEDQLLGVIQPLGIEAALDVLHRREEEVDAACRQRELALEQARFEAERRRRQYDAVEPENRLVAVDLEQRWNEALVVVRRREQELEMTRQSVSLGVSEEQRQALFALAHDVPSVWDHPSSSVEVKKRILRTLLKEIVVYVKDSRIRLLLHWEGGDHTEVEIQKNRPGHHRWKTGVEVEQIIRELARVMPDSRIAGLLNRAGKRTAKGLRWHRNHVCVFRNARDIAVYQEGERQARGELTLEEAAEALGVSTMTVRRLIEKKILPARQACIGAPWVIRQVDLNAPSVQSGCTGPSPTGDHRQRILDIQ
jgi:excisionase family DNA binding protein